MDSRTASGVLGRKVAVTVAASAVGLGGIAAAAALTAIVLVARVVITPPRRRAEDVRILEVTDSTITLSSSPDTRVPGNYSLWFDEGAGHVKLGDITRETPDGITRTVQHIDFGDLSSATRGRWAGWVYLDPADLGVPFENVSIDTEFGRAPAWLIQQESGAASSTWVIGVHGRGVRRSECLRAVPVFREAGYTSLLISYRNDGDAPASADGRYALGDTEWRDVEAAIEYAIAHGATDVVLMGWSMGGATVLQAATRSAHASVVSALVLESPVIDWVTALEYQGGELGLVRPLQLGVIALLGRQWAGRVTGQQQPIDLARLDFVTRASELTVPILLLHSADDGFVPVTASRALAAARPDIVTYDEFTVARHTKLWNYDADRWNATIARWLSERPRQGS